jgi:hypothetical protein
LYGLRDACGGEAKGGEEHIIAASGFEDMSPVANVHATIDFGGEIPRKDRISGSC